jgi:DNA-binding XRE family transcriptional regulator
MLVHVKTHLTDSGFEVKGDIPMKVVSYLKKNFEVNIEDDDDELVDITETDWYRKLEKSSTPGKSLRIYRERDALTQAALAEKIGVKVTAIHVSEMEHDKRPISKQNALKLARIFGTSADQFLV